MRRKDIEFVLRSLGSSEFKYTGDWVMTNCPLAKWTHDKGTDSHPSFGVREGQGISPVNCFACGFGGGVVSLVREYGRYAINEGIATKPQLDELVDYVLLAEDERIDVTVSGMMVEQPALVSSEIEESLGIYHIYFAERGIDEETARKWKLGWNFYEERVLFPVFTKEGKHDRLMGVVGRTLSGREPKYRNYPPRFKKTDYLYGEWLAPKELDLLVVVEGPIDAIVVNMALEEYEIERVWCVALMGADPSSKQLDKMVSMSEEVCGMLDNDASGKMGMLKLAGGSVGNKKYKGIGERCLTSVVMWEEGMNDPGELVSDTIIKLIQERKFVVEVELMKELGL